jgi:type II secretory pathway pseudopilin PulG
MSEKDIKLIKVLAIIAVVAIVAIAIVIVGPKILSGTGSVIEGEGKVVGTVGNAATTVASEAAGAVNEVTRQKGTSPVTAGTGGVISMFKNDPLYDGSTINVVSESGWFTDQTENNKLKDMYGDPIVLKYHGEWFYFGEVNDNYELVGFTIKNSIETRLWVGNGPFVTPNNDPPLTSIKLLMGHTY